MIKGTGSGLRKLWTSTMKLLLGVASASTAASLVALRTKESVDQVDEGSASGRGLLITYISSKRRYTTMCAVRKLMRLTLH